jgi:hypothetical protein
MGQVFEAEDIHLRRRVAVKVMGRAFDETNLRRFRQEAQVTAQLNHPHVVQLVDFLAGPPPFMVMELLVGESLRARLARETRMSLPAACMIATQVLSALQAAHEQGIVHRDIKPSNIFLVSSHATLFAKVLDFGIAKLLSAEGLALTKMHEVMGSAPYMSPQQIRGEQPDPRTDVFAIGSVLYEMLSGRRAFLGASAEQIMVGILEGVPVAPLHDVPVELANVISRAMSYDATLRFETAERMIEALAPFVPRFGDPPEGARAPLVATGAFTAPHVYASAPPFPQYGKVPLRVQGQTEPRRRARFVLMPLFAVGALGLGAYAWGTRDPVPSNTVTVREVSVHDAANEPAPELPDRLTDLAPPSTRKAVPVLSAPTSSGQPSARNCKTWGDCPEAEVCERGICKCPSGYLVCAGRCVDVTRDNDNCGACGAKCKANETCFARMLKGECLACGGPHMKNTVACGPHQCVDLNLSDANCGACGVSCPKGQRCGYGVCEVPAGLGEPCRRFCRDPNARCDTSGCACRDTAGFRECNGVCARSCDVAPRATVGP